MARLPITKTPKPYVGGAFIRSESGRTFPIQDTEGNFFANIPQCTRKDLRNAVESFENQLIRQALERTKWNKKQAATLLGLNRTTLVEMLKRKRINPRAA